MKSLKSLALEDLRGAFHLFEKDLEALPEEAYPQRFGPKTRTVADIVYEVNLVHEHVRLTMAGEPLFDWPEGFVVAPEGFETKATVLGAFLEVRDRLLSTVDSFSDEQMTEPIESDGRTTDRYERCRFISVHLWYHSGQLNFIQTLRGDDGWHWN